MKRIFCLALSLILAFLLFACSDSDKTSSDTAKPTLKAPILTNYERKPDVFDASDSEEKIIGKYDGDISGLLSDKEKALLELFSVPFDKVTSAEIVDMPHSDTKYIRAYCGDYKIDFFLDGEIYSIHNKRHCSVDENRTRIYDTVESLEPLEKAIIKALGIENMSIKREWFSHDSWNFDCSAKLDGKTVTELNSYSITFCSYDGELQYYVRGKHKVTSGGTPIVTSEQAIELSAPIFEKHNEKGPFSTELTYLAPNFYYEDGGPYEMADFFRLAWVVEHDIEVKCGTRIVFVDAETGEILGGSMYM